MKWLHIYYALFICIYSPIIIAKNIAIIGGGLSGLTTAYELYKKDLSHEYCVNIYEAKSTLGGRTYTHYFNDNDFYETGGTMIENYHENILEQAQELNIHLGVKDFNHYEFWITHNKTTHPVQYFTPYIKALLTQLDCFYPEDISESTLIKFQNILYHSTNPIIIYIKYFKESESGAPVQIDELETCHELLLTLFYLNGIIDILNANLSDEPVNPSFYALNGMSNWINALAKRILTYASIHLEYQLTEIDYINSVYILKFLTPSGLKTIIADEVVVTIPWSVLKNITITSRVGLTNKHLLAIQNLQYGKHSKIGIHFNEIPIPHNFREWNDLDNHIALWQDNHSLVLFLNNENAEKLQPDEAHRIVETYYNAFHNLYFTYPNTLSTPTYHIKNWQNDPFTQGSYSNYIPEFPFIESDVYFGLMNYAEPINNLIFAGEHTSFYFHGFMEGAVTSGKIAADIIWNKDHSIHK